MNIRLILHRHIPLDTHTLPPWTHNPLDTHPLNTHTSSWHTPHCWTPPPLGRHTPTVEMTIEAGSTHCTLCYQGACMAGETAIAADGTHPTVMHSFWKEGFGFLAGSWKSAYYVSRGWIINGNGAQNTSFMVIVTGCSRVSLKSSWTRRW